MSVRVARVAHGACACARVIHVGSHHHHRGSSCSYGRPPLRRHDTNRDRNQQQNNRVSLSLSRTTGVYTPRGDPTARAPRGIASSRFIAAAALVECRVAVLYPGSWKTTAHRATKGDIARRADGRALTAVR